MRVSNWPTVFSESLNKFVFTVAMPIMLFRLMCDLSKLPPVDARLLIAFFGGCLIVRPTGMHTNGGCKCPQDKIKATRLLQAGQQLAGVVAKCVSIETEQGDAITDRAVKDGP